MSDLPTLYRIEWRDNMSGIEYEPICATDQQHGRRGFLVPVTEICTVHWQPPIDERGFCPRGTEYDSGEWWEWDCDVRLVTDDE